MNKELISKCFIFAAGAAIGSAVTYIILKTKYEQIINEEIESVKEVYSRKKIEETIEEETKNVVSKTVQMKYNDEKLQKDLKDLTDIIAENKYAENKNPREEENENMDKDIEYYKPEVIPPDEFGEDEDYETESLTYYADEVLTDDMDNVIDDEDIDDMITYEALTRFGEWEDDSVFVRNDERKTYYEILLDTRNYSDL